MEAIASVYRDWGIGNKGVRTLVIPEAEKRFRDLTEGAVIVVGRKTFETFPEGKPLPWCKNIVMSNQDIEIEGATVVHSVDEVLETVKDFPKVYVVGGATVFYNLLHHCTKIHLTRIDAKIESDRLFINLDNEFNWSLEEESPVFDHEGIKYSFCEYEIYDIRKDFKKN